MYTNVCYIIRFLYIFISLSSEKAIKYPNTHTTIVLAGVLFSIRVFKVSLSTLLSLASCTERQPQLMFTVGSMMSAMQP